MVILLSLRDMQISKSEKNILAPPPPKSWGRPCHRRFNDRNIL